MPRAERFFLLILAGLFFSGCSDGRERVCLGKACYRVDVVRKEAERVKGLMFRKSLPAGQGMLFVFERQDIYPFWMKNMSFPIDILWLDAARRVVYVAVNVPPCMTDACPVYTPAAAASYVLEIPAGDAVKHRIKLGDALK